MFDIEPPRDTAALKSALHHLQEEIIESMEAFTDEEFFTPQGEYWAPSGHMRHLAKCIRPVAMAMNLPKLVIQMRFGSTKEGSRSFDQIRDLYLEALNSGEAQAGGYAPSSAKPDLSQSEWRAKIMGHFAEASLKLEEATESWPNKKLDSLRLVHPILGAMTIREMLFFTLYHNAHHARRVQERAVVD